MQAQTSGSEYFDPNNGMEHWEEKDVELLKAENEELKTQVQQYKFVSESFEKRVLDLQMEMTKKDEEMKSLKIKYQKCLDEKTLLHGKVEEEGDSDLMRKLFVGGLSHNTTDEMLNEYFSKYGRLAKAVVIKDMTSKKSRGFGFVIFEHSSMLDEAQAARPHTIDGKEVDTKRAVPKRAPANKMAGVQSKRIFVGGLKASTTNAILTEYFSKFGTVEAVNVLEDQKNNRNRGFAYVTFADSDTADKVTLQKFHNIDDRRCEIKPAISKVVMSKPASVFGPGTGAGMMGAHFPGHMPPSFGEQHGVNFPGQMGGNFPGQMGGNFPGQMGGNCPSMGRNIPGAMGPGFGPACGHMDSMDGHGHHCCNPVRNGCHSFPHELPSDCSHCGHHAQDFPPRPNQFRGNHGANWNRPGAVDPSLASPVLGPNGRGNGNFGKFGNVTFRNDPGSGKPIRNTSNFIQRGSGPY